MDKILTDIEYLRTKLGYSKRQLAALADISEEYYWRIVTGQAKGCSYTIIQSLCEVVGLQITTHLTVNTLDKFSLIK